MYIAGLYNNFDGERWFAILTTDANASMQKIHNRMPVVLRIQKWNNGLKAIRGHWIFYNPIDRN